MAVKVVDASALIAVLFDESEKDAVLTKLDGVGLIAPHLLRYEITNACAIKIRRFPEQRSAIKSAFDGWQKLSVRTLDVDHAAVLDLAGQTSLTAYDASYLWLSRALGLELVTLDKQLARAAATS